MIRRRPTNDQQTTINNNLNNENNVNNPNGLPLKIVEIYFEVDSGAVNTDPAQNLKAASDLLKLFERETPGLGPVDTLTAMRQFFEKCVNISDNNYLNEKASLPFIFKEFNRYKKAINQRKTLEQPESKGKTNQLYSNDIWNEVPLKAGTTPDLRSVDTNYLNEQ